MKQPLLMPHIQQVVLSANLLEFRWIFVFWCKRSSTSTFQTLLLGATSYHCITVRATTKTSGWSSDA